MAALQAGKHVLCEARMAMNASEARQMLRVKQQWPGLIAMVVPSPMTLRWDRTITRMVTEGYLGKLVAIDARGTIPTFAAVHWQGTDKVPAMHWRHDEALSGNNIISMGIFYEVPTSTHIRHDQLVGCCRLSDGGSVTQPKCLQWARRSLHLDSKLASRCK